MQQPVADLDKLEEAARWLVDEVHEVRGNHSLAVPDTEEVVLGADVGDIVHSLRIQAEVPSYLADLVDNEVEVLPGRSAGDAYVLEEAFEEVWDDVSSPFRLKHRLL